MVSYRHGQLANSVHRLYSGHGSGRRRSRSRSDSPSRSPSRGRSRRRQEAPAPAPPSVPAPSPAPCPSSRATLSPPCLQKPGNSGGRGRSRRRSDSRGGSRNHGRSRRRQMAPPAPRSCYHVCSCPRSCTLLQLLRNATPPCPRAPPRVRSVRRARDDDGHDWAMVTRLRSYPLNSLNCPGADIAARS